MNIVRSATPRPPGSALRLAGLALAGLFLTLASTPVRADMGVIGPIDARVQWRTIPHQVCAGQSFTLRFRHCDCAWDLQNVTFFQGGLKLRLSGDPDRTCVTCTPDSVDIVVPGVPGPSALVLPTRLVFATDTDSTVHDDFLDVAIGPACPPPSLLPYLSHVQVEGGPPCEGCPTPVCPGDSIDVRLAGSFPDACHTLVGVTLEPNPSLSPLPQPPIVRITYGSWNPCAACAQVPTPWQAQVRLPPQPYVGGSVQVLPVEARELALCTPDSTATPLGRLEVPFVVTATCSTETACYAVSWLEFGRAGRCAATYGPDHPADVVLRMSSASPISGIEGTLVLETDALEIDGVTSARDGWAVQWTRRADRSVRFLAFASSPGAAIPPDPSTRAPVIQVRVRASVLAIPLPESARLRVEDLLVSDPRGQALLPCPEPAIDPPSSIAVLCRGGRCDANDDGQQDVRDLVVMVGCLDTLPGDSPTCGDTAGLDCDRSGSYDLDDVFCCARAMLGGGIGLPGGPTREAELLSFEFDEPRLTEDGLLEVWLGLRGVDLLETNAGAARVDLAYPAERYEIVRAEYVGPTSLWWSFVQVDGDRVRLAMVNIGFVGSSAGPDPRASTASTLGSHLRLELRLKPGAQPGGTLSVASYAFAGMDGAILTTPNGEAHLPLGPGGGEIAMTAPRPNPFAGSTTFTVHLPDPTGVDVGVYDVTGRRIATLVSTVPPKGQVYWFTWDGSDDLRGRAVPGVYFARITTPQGGASRKLLYLPGGAR